MQRDFHYDIIYTLSRKAAYRHEDAHVIACSSQYVDDNTDREYTVSDSYGAFYVDFPERIGKSGSLYFPIITQAADISLLKLSVQRYVYVPFHFIPGDNNLKIKNKTNPFCTTKGCKNAVSLLQDAVKSGDMYRIGIALHTYADTWSHQGFSGVHEDWNRVYKSNFLRNLPPNIGHCEVYNRPDEISLEWVDERFGTERISNRSRALDAAKNIFGMLNRGNAEWKDIRTDFEKIIEADTMTDRIRLVRGIYQEIREYDEDSWLNEALKFARDAAEIMEFDPVTGPRIAKPRFVDVSVRDADSHWFRFQGAAKKQLAQVLGMVSAL